MKTTYKDAKISLRLSSELLDDLRVESEKLNVSLSDYINKVLIERKQANQIEIRFKNLEDAVFGNSQAA